MDFLGGGSEGGISPLMITTISYPPSPPPVRLRADATPEVDVSR